MEEMHIKCPHCGNEMDVSLRGKKSSMIVCVCGHCKSPLVSLDGDVFELDRDEFQALRKRLSRVVDALVSNVESSQANLSSLVGKGDKALPSANDVPETPKKSISKEDLDNLRIDLETCKDVSDFIDKL